MICNKTLSFQPDQLGYAAIPDSGRRSAVCQCNYLFIPDVRKAVEEKWDSITAYKVGEELTPFTLTLGELTDDEREIILKGCLINYYRNEGNIQ